jgi:hypothetical protein
VKTIVNAAEDKIPLRKNFDADNGDNAWQIVNPTGSRNWETTSTNYDQSLYFEGDDNSSEQEYSWFVSPVLDFSDAVQRVYFSIYLSDIKVLTALKILLRRFLKY